MEGNRPKVCVVGGGVIGLGSAYFIKDLTIGHQGVDVTVIAERYHPDITSSVAAGFWAVLDIVTVCKPEQLAKLRKWSVSTWDHMNSLNCSEEATEAGTCLSFGYTLLDKPDPHFLEFWRDTFFNFRKMGNSELEMFPPFRHGYSYITLLSDSVRYVPWLMNKLKEKNVRFITRKINSLVELAKDYDVIVNCTGLGAAQLVGDSRVQPGRGQVIKVQAPWIKQFVIAVEENAFYYIFPGPDTVVLGGTYQKDNWNLEPTDEDRKNIWEGCCKVIPSLKHAKVLRDAVGLRPLRDSVRLESELITTPQGRKWVVHNYGHGGAGITTHWGCGQEAAELVKDCLQKIVLQAKL
ncbi:D-aspartate oxidase-like [Lineus longissimus]|uniref:D-aspartate oxidase-like n=1 Tax=Lineus longissimus TaxID=88925 RepID=UPI002B4F0D82